MSINSTEKNNRDHIEKLILDCEKIITQESIMWSGMNGKQNKSKEGNNGDESAKSKKDNN